MTTGTDGAISIDPNGSGNLTLGSADNTSTSLSGNVINIDAAGALTLDGAAGVNIAGNAAEVDVTTTGAVDINGADITVDASAGISLDAAAASNVTTSVGALTLNGAAGVDITSTLDVTGLTSMAAISSDGVVTLSNNTTSSSSSTGALKVTGGVGIADNLNVGGTLDVTGNITGNVTGNVTGNADTATLASTVSINYSSTDANAVTNGTEYSSTASLASGTRLFDNGNGISTFLSENTFNAGIDLTANSVITITPTLPAYYTIGGTTKIPLQFIISIDDTDNKFTIKTYSYISSSSSFNLAVPDIDFTFNFQIFK
jgi:hypothetical protein